MHSQRTIHRINNDDIPADLVGKGDFLAEEHDGALHLRPTTVGAQQWLDHFAPRVSRAGAYHVIPADEAAALKTKIGECGFRVVGKE